MKNIGCIILLIISNYVSAQDASIAEKAILAQHKLLNICQELYHPSKKLSDAEKQRFNSELVNQFEAILKEPNSFSYPFDSLKTEMAVLTSADNKFRIINWNVPKSDETEDYYGFIQENYTNTIKKGLFKREHIDSVQLYSLIDKSAEIKNPENAITDNKKWFGALYNKIIIKKTKAKTYYTLLAWDGNDKFTKKKIIEVLTFDANGTPRFGADIFNMQKKYPKRVIFEYSANCNISLRYSAKKDSIVFDHLAPNSPQLEGQFQYYCSDGSYDGFGFKRGKWNYGEYINATNEKDEKDKLYGDPHDKSVGNNESIKYIDPNKKKKKKSK